MTVLGVLATTVIPTAVGMLVVRGGGPLTRLGLGGLFGIAAVGVGGLLGGFVDAVTPGAIAGLVVLGSVGYHYPLERPAAGVSRLAPALFGFVLLAGVALLVLAPWRPIGFWDSWAIWGLKAKGLATANGFSSPVFTEGVYAYSLPEYPPLQPVWQSLAYELAGTLRANWMLQVQLAWLWLCGALAIVGTSARWRGGAVVVPFAWLVSPFVLERSLSGYADVPMALFLVTGAVLLWQTEDLRGAVYAGLLLGAAALVKTEGLVPAVALAIAFGLKAGYRRRAAVGGVVVVALQLPWMILVRARGITNTIINRESLDLDRLVEVIPTRFETVVTAFGTALADVTRWGPLVILIVVVLAIGDPDGRLALATVGVFTFLGLVYLVTPLDFERHISRSIHRVHIAPLGLAALTAAVGLHRRAQRHTGIRDRDGVPDT